ncbi:MAG: CBS domain-containing protein [Acidimicrobiales bacterium]|nr:CBS domain-containing protein [Acidimicrobiales bacterium]
MTDAANVGSMGVGILSGGPVIRVGADATLHEVADLLVEAGIGALVVGGVDRATGIVSERDVVAALAARRDPETTRAGDIARSTLVWCDAEATIAEVAERMMERYVRHVLLEEDGRLVGIVSARDLLGAYAGADMADMEEMAELAEDR